MLNTEIVNTIVCYQNHEEVLEYANKVATLQKSETICLVLVINKLEETNIDLVKKEVKNIELDIIICDPGKNLGYMNGMLYGYKYYKNLRYNHTPKYVIMSNTDIEYPDNLFIAKLLKEKYDDDIWVIGPAVYVPSRSTYDNPICSKRRSLSDINKLIWIFSRPLMNKLYIKASLIKGHIVKNLIGSSRRVYEVHGCFFITKGEMANKLLKEPFGALLYSEETYIAEIAYKNEKSEYYDANLIVSHIEHTVTGKVNTEKIAFYLCESMKVIKKDFYNILEEENKVTETRDVL